MTHTIAYCVSEDGVLLRNTTHSHARGAMVNWLYTRVGNVPGNLDDEQVRTTFLNVREHCSQKLQPPVTVDLEKVRVYVITPVDPRDVPLLEDPAA